MSVSFQFDDRKVAFGVHNKEIDTGPVRRLDLTANDHESRVQDRNVLVKGLFEPVFAVDG